MRNLTVIGAVLAIALGCNGDGLATRVDRSAPAVLLIPYYTTVGDVWSSNGVTAYKIDAATGGLKLVSGSPFPTGLNPTASALVPSGPFAYVINKQSSNVSGYRIDPRTGALSPIPGSPFALADFNPEPTGIFVDPLGKRVYALSNAGIFGFSVDPATGSLRRIPGSPFAVEGRDGGFGNTAMTIEPGGQFAYVLNDWRHSLSAYAIDAAGALKPTGTPSKVDRNGSLTIDPKGRFEYLVSSCCIDSYAIEAKSGALTPSAHLILGVAGLDDVGGFAIDPAGKFAYAVLHKYTAAGSRVYAYRIDTTTGALTALDNGRYVRASASDPYALSIDRAGTFAYVFNRGTPAAAITIDAYRISRAGRLRPLPHSPFTAAALIADPIARWFNAGHCSAFDGVSESGSHSPPVAKRGSDLDIDQITPGYFYDPKRRFALHYPFGDAGGTITLQVSGKPPAGVSLRNLGQLRTTSGISLGSRSDSVVKALGLPKIIYACHQRAYFYVTPGGMQLLREFTISNGVVTGISQERGG